MYNSKKKKKGLYIKEVSFKIFPNADEILQGYICLGYNYRDVHLEITFELLVGTVRFCSL